VYHFLENNTIAILGELDEELTYYGFMPMGKVEERVRRPYSDPSKPHQCPIASPHENIYDFDPTYL
jgi:hypothetical protein